MAKQTNDFSLDSRIVGLNIERGTIDRKGYESHLKSLPDLAGQYDEMPAYEEPTSGDADDSNLTFSVA